MFDSLSSRLQDVFKKLKGVGRLSEAQIEKALKEIRLALLEADVNYKVVKRFIGDVSEKAKGKEVLESLTPAQQVIKIVHDELVSALGGGRVAARGSSTLDKTKLNPVMIVGLNGSGKTTSCAKLAAYYKKQGYSPLVIAADMQRPAAVLQLKQLGEKIGVEVFSVEGKTPCEVVTEGLAYAYKKGSNLTLIDTAGRLHVDKELMEELVKIKDISSPAEIFLVLDAMTGQESVNIASTFKEYLDISGVVFSKYDGDSRGGATLSIKYITGLDILFVGTGEKPENIEYFYPDRVASRILGMGDVLSLIEKAQDAFDAKKAMELEKKLLKEEFTFEDFLEQIKSIKNMGSLEQVMEMIPGIGSLKKKGLDLAGSENEFKKVEAIINSMTRKERLAPSLINGSRKIRIAKGSGTTVNDVNRLLNQFKQAKGMMKKMSKFSKMFGSGKSSLSPFLQ